MSDSLTEVGPQYSTGWGFVYLFNLIVGTGALTMPHAFQVAGWLVSVLLVLVLGVMSFITCTFVLEVLSSANAVLHLRRQKESPDSSNSSSEVEPLLGAVNTDISNVFTITHRVELGQMAALFFNRIGQIIFYICIIVYLFGDLAIYTVTVSKSLQNVICIYADNTTNGSVCAGNVNEDLACWKAGGLTRKHMYWICLSIFAVTVCPWVFFNVQKTKYLQITTTTFRWLAFSTMIVLSLLRRPSHTHSSVAKLSGFPTLFGASVYSFMCHHSLPAIAAPARRPSQLPRLFALAYGVITLFYLLLSLTAVFSFPSLLDVYTLNFLCDPSNHTPAFIRYTLALFPVFALSTSFPIIGISLRNNLSMLLVPLGMPRFLSPCLVVLVPLGIALVTQNVALLVAVTGSYAGVSIQYFVPCFLLWFSRKHLRQVNAPPNPLMSPFRHRFWVLLVLVWAVCAIVLATVNNIVKLGWINADR